MISTRLEGWWLTGDEGRPMPTVALAGAEAPLVLGLDLGTSSLRALLFDRAGRAIADSEEQHPHRLRTSPAGAAVTDAPALFDLLLRCVDGALARAGGRAGEIAAVGTSCFWHSLLGLDAAGEPLTPLLMWADRRSAPQAAAMRAGRGNLAPAALHARTGCALHSSYWPAKLRWLRERDPETFGRVARWLSFAEYVAGRLHGEARVSIAMASGTGILDVHRLSWDGPLLEALGIRPEQLSRLVDRDAAEPGPRPEFAARWPALARVPWFPAVGDGACANVGCGAVGPGRLALTVGTSGALRVVRPAAGLTVPDGLWAYRLDRERAIIGGATSNGGVVLAWLADLVGAEFGDATMAAADALPPDGHGLTLLPFVAGERFPPHLDAAAGVAAGLTLATTPPALLRAGMEAVACRMARIHDRLAPQAAQPHQIVANGAAILRSPTWLQMIADALGHELIALPPEEEASARGAAILALAGAGILPNLGAAPDPAGPEPRVYRPDAARHRVYRAALDRQVALEATLFPEPGGD